MVEYETERVEVGPAKPKDIDIKNRTLKLDAYVIKLAGKHYHLWSERDVNQLVYKIRELEELADDYTSLITNIIKHGNKET